MLSVYRHVLLSLPVWVCVCFPALCRLHSDMTGISIQLLNLQCDHDQSEFYDGECRKVCGELLLCGDICKGTCSSCHQGRIHVTCQQPCAKLLICGHDCTFPCKMFCPPCPKPCKTKCPHRECDKVCGSPCAPCKEPCAWLCPHEKCTKLCSELCDRDLCAETCSIVLDCGHKCVGVCGETCPPCNTCLPDKFISVFHTGEEELSSARFIQLIPCEHPIEMTSLITWLKNEEGEVSAKRCPLCSTIIENCQNLKEVKSAMKVINEIKSKEFGSLEAVKKLQETVFSEMSLVPFYIYSKESYKCNPRSDSPEFIARSLATILENSISNNKYHTALSMSELSALSFKLEFLKEMRTVIESYWKQYGQAVRNDIVNQAMFIFKSMCSLEYFQKQQFEDFKNEQKRLYQISLLIFICSTGEYLANRNKSNVNDAYNKIVSALNRSHFTEDMSNEVEQFLKYLKLEVKIASQVTTDERKMIHKAMSSSFNQGNKAQGHWFKCTGGHIYCITECGGPEELSICPDCKEHIGGQRHRYVNTAQVASEMDGARYPVWSAQNDLNNYDLGNQTKHWYKCRNGHIYFITGCGAAQQMSTCPECKVRIGRTGDLYKATEMYF